MVVVLGFVRAVPAAAQSSHPAGAAQQSPVVLGDLYAQVLRANPRVAAARALTRAAESRVAGVSRPPDPQLQLGFMNYSLPRLAPMATVGMNQLQLMQMVPYGGKLSLARRAASARASATAFRAEDVSWDLRSQAAMAFYDLYSTDRGLEVVRETVRLLRDIAATTEAMYRVGAGRQTDVLRARVEIARMSEDTLRMQAMRQSMTARLAALLDGGSNALGTPALPAFPDTIPTRAWLDSVSGTARPMIRGGVAEVQAADALALLARKEILPDLQVGVQYAQRTGDMGTERMGSLMLGVSLPVFARSRQFQMREEAGAMKEMAQADLAAMRAETRGKVGEAYAGLVRARTLAQLYRTTVLPEAEATVASALAAYRVGSVDFMTLLDDRMTVNKYRQELYVLESDQGKAWADLEMLAGIVLFDAHKRGGSVVAANASTTGAAP